MNFPSSRLRTALLIPALLALCAFSCASNPFKTANTATADNKPETIALATYGTFVIAEESAADLISNPATPSAAKAAVKAADAAASPAVEHLRDAAIAVEQLRDAIKTGSSAAGLPAALLKVNQLLTDVAPKIKALTDAYTAAKPVATSSSPRPIT